MGRPEEYRRYARECLEVASALRVPRARAALHHMAQVWLRLMQDARCRHLPIVHAGKVLGIVSHGDFSGLERDRLDEETGLWERIG